MHAHILGVGTAVPAHTIAQTSVRDRARTHFTGLSDASRERLLRIYENTGIERRFWANDVEWYTTQRPFDERNAQWHEQALDMAEEASRAALAAAGVEASRVQAVVMVTTSGIATPSPEAYLIQRLGIPLSATRLPIWGLGCAGGAAGLARGAELATLRPNTTAALVGCTLGNDASQRSSTSPALGGRRAGRSPDRSGLCAHPGFGYGRRMAIRRWSARPSSAACRFPEIQSHPLSCSPGPTEEVQHFLGRLPARTRGWPRTLVMLALSARPVGSEAQLGPQADTRPDSTDVCLDAVRLRGAVVVHGGTQAEAPPGCSCRGRR